MNKKKSLTLLIVFIFAFCWGLFFTCGLDFLWEDIIFYHLDKAEHPLNTDLISRFSLMLRTFKGFIKEFFVPERLFQIGFGGGTMEQTYSDRPFQFLTYDFLRAIFHDNIVMHRIFKAIFFSINACIVFIIINRISRALAFLGSFLYITSGVVWTALVYSSDVTIYSQSAMFISILLFFKLLEKKPLHKKDLWLFYLSILIISNYAVLSKGEGRELAIIFFLTILLFRRKEFLRHLPMLTILLLMEIPILGYITKLFTGFPSSPIDVATHNPHLASQSLKSILQNSHYLRIAIGNLMLVILIIAFVIHLLYLLMKKSSIFQRKDKSESLLKEQSFVLFLWVFFTLIGTAMSRNFAYTGESDWSMLEITFFSGAFIIFLCYYVFFIGNFMKNPYRKIFFTLCIGLMIAQIIFVKLPRLNHLRGGWGNYFCAMKNTEKFIDSASNNALSLTINKMHYKPFVFRNSDNEIISNIAVTEDRFTGIVKNTHGLFSDLILKGYIDQEGIIQNKFRALKNEAEMALSVDYASQRAAVFKVLSNGYVLPGEKSPFRNLAYLEKKFVEGNYKDIFVVKRGAIKFTGESSNLILKSTNIIDGDSGDLYDSLKRFIKRPSQPLIYVYHFMFDKEEAINKI